MLLWVVLKFFAIISARPVLKVGKYAGAEERARGVE